MHSSAGGAEWKTSDFVVTLIKEQQVPVCLSAQAELFSPRQLLDFRNLLTRFPSSSAATMCKPPFKENALNRSDSSP